MPQRQGKCINFGLCTMADSREAITLPEGEDFSCPECGKMLAELEGKGGAGGGGSKGGGKSKLALAGLAVVLLGVGGYFLLQPDEEKKPPVVCGGDNAPAGCVAPVPPQPQPQPVPKPPDPVPPAPEPTPVPTPVPTPPPPEPKPIVPAPEPKLKKIVPPKPKPEPVVEEPKVAAYTGPSSGEIVWEGNVHGTEFVTIESGSANKGVLLSGKLPGVPVLIQPQNPKKIGIAGAPGPDSKYQRVTLRVQGNGQMKVVLNWSLP